MLVMHNNKLKLKKKIKGQIMFAEAVKKQKTNIKASSNFVF